MITIFDKIITTLLSSSKQNNFLLALALLSNKMEVYSWYFGTKEQYGLPKRELEGFPYSIWSIVRALNPGDPLGPDELRAILLEAKQTYEKKCKANSV